MEEKINDLERFEYTSEGETLKDTVQEMINLMNISFNSDINFIDLGNDKFEFESKLEQNHKKFLFYGNIKRVKGKWSAKGKVKRIYKESSEKFVDLEKIWADYSEAKRLRILEDIGHPSKITEYNKLPFDVRRIVNNYIVNELNPRKPTGLGGWI